MLGLVGLYLELSSPGLILPGVVGGISLILALYAMQTLPVNYAGLLLIMLGVALFIAEISVMSYGLLSVSGATAIFFGSIMLIDSDDPVMQISRTVLYPTLGMTFLFVLGTIYLATKSHQLQTTTGIEGLMHLCDQLSDYSSMEVDKFEIFSDFSIEIRLKSDCHSPR